MKLHRLELTGFGPFRERQTVDFDAFDRDGVFLISGRTGAGKSSILDGVSFALYGAVARYESGERRLRSDHSHLGDPTEVRLEFTVGDARWRVTRAPEYERPAKRGDKLTTEPARAELDELVAGVWIGRAAKPREVALLLDEILGLNAQQFQQVILLAQNRFSRFLLARNDERQSLLRTLFGTRRFEQYKDDLDARRRAAKAELDAAGEQTRTLLDLAESAVRDADGGHIAADEDAPPADDLSARRDAVDRARQRAQYRVEQSVELEQQAAAAHVTAVAAHAELVAQSKTLDELDTMRERLAGLDADAARIATDSARLDRARAAESLRATLEVAERAAADADAAVLEAERAERRRLEVGGAPGDDLDDILEALTGDIALWADAATRERDLTLALADRDACAAAEVELTARLAVVTTERARVPAERERIDVGLAESAALAARGDDLRLRRDELTAQAAAATDADRLAGTVAAAESAYAIDSAAADAAGAAVTDLLRRRLAGRAAELAHALVAGGPCPVCGGVEHPHPAVGGDEPVTDDDLAEAEAHRDAATLRSRESGADAARLRAEHAAAAARAGGRGTAELAGLVAEAAAAVAAADDASARAVELTRQRAALDELDGQARDEQARLGEEAAAVRERLAAAAVTVATLESEVTAARGAYETVAARLAATTEHRDRARAALDARSARDERRRAADGAVADRDARIDASDFADPAEVVAALLPAGERADIDARVAGHAAELTATRARLLELELAAAGAGDRPDLDASATRVARSDAARTAAIAAARDAVHDADDLRDLVSRIDVALAAIADRATEAAVVTRLADTVAGRAPNTRKMDLETFVLAAELEEIVAAANLRLRDMSSGRFTLHHSDALQARGAASGLALDVLDAHTGRLRSPQSLSGGETFLASLALALGLAEVVTGRAGGIRLDTLFVDEGFGSLDPETLELAMRTLDELRAGGRTVGVISHVEAMKEQLPAQIVVEATPEGPSVIRQDRTPG